MPLRMSTFAESTGVMVVFASRRRFSKSSVSKGLATATVNGAGTPPSSARMQCFCAYGRETVLAARFMSSLSGSIFR